MQFWYEHNPEQVTENDSVRVIWVSHITIDRHMPCKTPGTVVMRKKQIKSLLIAVAIPSDVASRKRL